MSLSPRREHRPRLFACCACGDAMRLALFDGTIMTVCRPCAATFSMVDVHGRSPAEWRSKGPVEVRP